MPARAPLVGALAALAAILTILAPYAVLASGELAVYYGVGPVSPLVVAVFAAVAAVALLGVARGTADPATTTGAALVLGLTVLALLAWWAFEAGAVVGGLDVAATFDYHRWVLVAVAAVVPLAAAGHAWTVLGPQGP